MAQSEPTETALAKLPKIPLGVSDWGSLRAGNYLVVDKTAKLKELVAFHSVFLARPRRMGKSTLCSMLHELFAHGKESFAGKAIYELWSEPTYPVIHLFFNRMGTDVSQFEVRLKEHIVHAFRAAGCAEATRFDQSQSLSGLLDQCLRS